MILFSRELHMRHMHIKLYFRINPIPRLEIYRAVTNVSAVYILLGEILCPPAQVAFKELLWLWHTSLVKSSSYCFLVVDLNHLFDIVQVLYTAVVDSPGMSWIVRWDEGTMMWMMMTNFDRLLHPNPSDWRCKEKQPLPDNEHLFLLQKKLYIIYD